MAMKLARKTVRGSYLKLIHEFPLRHIKNDAELDVAILMLDRLLQQEPDEGTTEYLEVLTDLVEAYEDQHIPVGDVSAADVLRELMRSNCLTQRHLSEKVGIAQSTISAVLNNTRQLNVDHMQALGDHFGIDAAVFMPNR